MKLKIKKLIPDLDLRYHSDGASGIDIVCPVDIIPGSYLGNRIFCGFCLEIPYGFEGQIRPRSSLSALGLNIHFGTIDNDYRGEISVIFNWIPSERYSVVKKGERIAQLVICPVQRCEIEFVDELSTTKRGNGGFGSTGK